MFTTDIGQSLTVLQHKNDFILSLLPVDFDLSELDIEFHWQSQFGNHIFHLEDMSTGRGLILLVLADSDVTKQLGIVTQQLKFGTYSLIEINDPEDKEVLSEYDVTPRSAVFDRVLMDCASVWPNLGKRLDKTLYPRGLHNFTYPRFNSVIHEYNQTA